MHKARANNGGKASLWRHFLLIPALIVALSVGGIAKARAEDPMRAALVAQATAALACVPTSGSLHDFLHYTGTIPVADCALLHLFASFVLAQAIPFVGQWDVRLSEIARDTEALGALQQAQMKANLAANQSQIDMRSRMVGARATDIIAREFYYTKDNKVCPLVSATSTVDQIEDAKQAVSQALSDALRWQGVAGDNPNARIAWFALMCKLKLFDTSISRDLLKSSCPDGDSEYSRSTMNLSSVIGEFEYAFPSNIKKFKDNRLSFDTPQDEDMPALSAIMFCATLHVPTGNPVASSGREAIASDIDTAIRQVRTQLHADTFGDLCMGAVADRIAVPASVSVQELKRVHDQQAKFCLQMHKTGCMSDQDFQHCQTYGMSSLNIRRHIACQHSIPACVINGLVKRGFGSEEVTQIVEAGKKMCSDYSKSVARQNQMIIDMVKRNASRVPVVEAGATGRSSQ